MSTELEGCHAEDGEEEREHPEPEDDLVFMPSLEFEMVVDGGHGEDAFAVAQLVAAHLQDDGHGFHDEDAPDDDKEKLLRRADGSHAERSAQGQGAGVSHKYPGRVAIVPQEAQAGPCQGHHEDADFSRAGVEGNIQGISRQPASAEDGNDGVSNARGDGAAGGSSGRTGSPAHRPGRNR